MGWVIFTIIVAIALLAGITALISRQRDEDLDAELTAYVAAGSMPAETAKAILGTAATTARKREIAALIADGMAPAKGLTLLNSMAAT
jgi:hypothetical protein